MTTTEPLLIDWGAMFPPRVDVPAKQNKEPGGLALAEVADAPAKPGRLGDDADREAWEERAAILEFDGGMGRQAAEALADSEEQQRRQRAEQAARADDDRRRCRECRRYENRRCTIARPGGMVSARTGYEPIPDLSRRCEGFAPLESDHDQRAGRDRWPGL